jgi:hypothetical protein
MQNISPFIEYMKEWKTRLWCCSETGWSRSWSIHWESGPARLKRVLENVEVFYPSGFFALLQSCPRTASFEGILNLMLLIKLFQRIIGYDE